MKKLLLFGVFLGLINIVYSQNIAITDDDAYTANTSAMLDVKSLTKGMLVPRMTTAQRTAIVSPATGLLVFDTTINGFYYYNGSAWINLSSGSSGGMFWSYTSPNIYMTTTTDKLGLGISNPSHKLHLYESVATVDGTDGNFIDIQNSNSLNGVMSGIRFQNGTSANTFKGGIFYQDISTFGKGNLIFANNTTALAGNVTAADARLVLQSDGRVMVKGDPNQGVNAAIFAVQNSDGDTVFAVYPEGVRVWVNDDGGSKAAGSRGGFAVGGYSPSKAGFTNEYLRVTPDSVRVYIDDEFVASKASGNRGGFAVGGFSPTKGSLTDQYLFVQDDSTRVYVVGDEGFAIDNIAVGSEARYSELTPRNYLIGHQAGGNVNNYGWHNSIYGYMSGSAMTLADRNTFMGYCSGMNFQTGMDNVFIGSNAGKTYTSGSINVLIGSGAGENSNLAYQNVYIGAFAGQNSTTGSYNTFIGYATGNGNANGCDNTYYGYKAGVSGAGQNQNVYIGSECGRDASGSGNIFLGYQTGYSQAGSNQLLIDNSNTTTPLIYGNFASDYLRIYGKFGINTVPTYLIHSVDITTTNDNPAVFGSHEVTDNYGIGVQGTGKWRGVYGLCNTTSGSGIAVYGYAYGSGTGSRYGIYGYAGGGATNYAGYFAGDVTVTGTLSKGGGSFKIDHPLDPENKILYHSFVESPDMKNIYDGVVIMDASGKATVMLPSYFDALNKDFRYQLTAIGVSSPNLFIEQKIQGNQFVIAGGTPGMEVSWQVTGTRKDPFANKYRIPEEVMKDDDDKGFYVHPDVYEMPQEKGIDFKNRNK